MRKKLVPTIRDTDAASRHDWLELERVARVEVSSEAKGYPVEGALLKDGQRADGPLSEVLRSPKF